MGAQRDTVSSGALSLEQENKSFVKPDLNFPSLIRVQGNSDTNSPRAQFVYVFKNSEILFPAKHVFIWNAEIQNLGLSTVDEYILATRVGVVGKEKENISIWQLTS